MPARRRNSRRTRQVTAVAVGLAGLLVLRQSIGAAPAAFCAGLVSGFLACALAVTLVPPRADKWARRLGTRARDRVNRPAARLPKPASTPIHDEAARRQNGA